MRSLPLAVSVAAAATAASLIRPASGTDDAVPGGAFCSPSEFRCWDDSYVYANPPDCSFTPCPPCPNDSFTCEDGTVVGRDPMTGCNFKPCAQKSCPKDTKTCPNNGAVVRRDPDNFCEFKECPSECSSEHQVCEDGSKVYRNPLNRCQFDLCGGRQRCAPDVYECPAGMGYVYRNEDNNCEFFTCALATASTDGVPGGANTHNYARRKAVYERIKATRASHPSTLFALSPQFLALEWLATADTASLDPDHPALMQRYALAVFYFSTFTYEQLGQINLSVEQDLSHGWVDESGWLSGAGHCSWFGIQCEKRVVYDNDNKPVETTTYDDSAKVTHINLVNNNIRGVLPREFAMLHDLKVLDLSQNVLAGPIPSLWGGFNGNGGMNNLQVLALQVNRLVGPIPLQLFQFKHLTLLNLEYNWLNGQIPDYWHMLPNLRQIRLGLNEFNGTIPIQLYTLENLIVLWLDSNDLEGEIPYTFQWLKNVQSLFLHRNKLSGQITPKINGMTSLKEFTIAENKITGPIPSEMGTMKNLYSLFFENNKLIGPIPTELGNLENLSVLRLFNNDIKTPMPKEICKLRNDESSQLVWLAADCAEPHESLGGSAEVMCRCCDECHGGAGASQ